jgi:O-antigen ligase
MLEGVRWSVAKASLALGWEHAPLGAGVGSFVEWFGQAAPVELTQRTYYFNHAHNEYAQWWLESGVLAVVSVLGVLGLLACCFPRAPITSAMGDHGVAVAAWLGCVLMLMQSWVDYPLRTPALMAVAGLLAGIVVGQSHARKLRVDNRDNRDNTPVPTSRRQD